MFELGKYKVITLPQVVRGADKITSNCMTISFRNQGTTDAHITPENSGGAVLKLKPNESRTYGVFNPEMEYTGRFDVEFSGAGTGELYIEKERVELKPSCE
jgi:hypothetical protein